MDKKKILLIILLLSFSAAIAYGLYYMFTKSQKIGQPPSEEITGQTSTLPTSGQRPPITTGDITQDTQGGLTSAGVIQETKPSYYKPDSVVKVTSDYAVSPSLSNSGDMRYYNGSDGKFYRVRPDGVIEKMSDKVFYGAEKITWAKNKDQAIIEYPDESKIIYNFSLKKQTTSLPKHWSDFSFSPDGSEIAAKSIGLAPESRWLVTMNDDGTDTQLIEHMGTNADKVTVSWSPSRQVVAFSKTGAPLGLDRQEILLVGLNGENFKSLAVEGQGFESSWSNSGKKLIYSVYSARSDYKPELWISDAYGEDIGNNRKMLKINTWSDKCVFSDDNTLFCAVPRELPQGAGMSREAAVGTYDDLYKIDLQTGLKTPIALNDNYTVKTISYDQGTNKLYFTDSYRNGVFETQL